MNSEKFLKDDIAILYYIYKSPDPDDPHLAFCHNTIPKLKIGDKFKVHYIDNDGLVHYKFGHKETEILKFKNSQIGLHSRPLKNHMLSFLNTIKEMLASKIIWK